MARVPVRLITSPDQWSVLTAPVRFEIVEAMRDLAPCGVAAIATHLQVRPDTLYRHIEILQEFGYVTAAGFRKVSRGTEQLFDLTADDFNISFDTDSDPGPANDMVRDTAAVFLKRMGKTIDRTAAARQFDTTVRGKNAVILSDYARLTPEEFKELAGLMRKVKELLDSRRGRGSTQASLPDAGQLYSVLITAVPVVRRTPKPQARTRANRPDSRRQKAMAGLQKGRK